MTQQLPEALQFSDTVQVAFMLAKEGLPGGGYVDSSRLLEALTRAEDDSAWNRLLIAPPDGVDERPADDGRFGLPLTEPCTNALRRSIRIAEAYGLRPVPPGVVAIGLASEPGSKASMAFVGLDADEAVQAIEETILGVDLEGLERVIREIGTEVQASHMATPTQPSAAFLGLLRKQFVAFGATWFFRLLTVLAIVGTVIALRTSDSWNYRQVDDLRPPIERSEVADAVLSNEEIGAALGGAEMVRIQDGLPSTQLFESNLPFFYDSRQQAISGAWEAGWTSVDAHTHAMVQLIQVRGAGASDNRFFGRDCEPQIALDWGQTVQTAGISAENTDRGVTEVCAVALVDRTEVFVAGITSALSRDELAEGVRRITESTIQAVPEPSGPAQDGFTFEATRAQIIRGLFIAALAIPFLWALPTILFDRATWQRIGWTLTLRRFRYPRVGTWDVDPQARSRLWVATAQATVQICLIVWTIRATQRWGTIETGAAIIVAGLIPSVIPRLLYLRKRRTQMFKGRRRVLALLGLLPAATVVGVALLAANLGQIIGQFGGPVSNVPDHVYQRISLGVQIAAIPLALLALLPMTLMRRVAMRQVREETIEDDRPPILLLRSFADDKRRLRARSSSRRTIIDRLALRRWERFEEVIAGALGRHGPVLAVGQVGERLPPPLGAVRRQFSNEEWQARVHELMEESSTICLVVGRSTSLAWEIQRIRDHGHLHKTIFVFPPTNRREHRRRLTVLGSLLDLSPDDLAAAWNDRWAVAVTFPGPGLRPITLAARAQEDVTYDVAIETAMEMRSGEGWPPDLRQPAEGQWTGPTAQIYPLGQTPRYKPTARRVIWIGASVLLPIVGILATGFHPDQVTSINLDPAYSTSMVAVDGTTDDVYAVLNSSAIVQADFESKDLRLVRSIDVSSEMVADRGSVYVAADFAGTVTKIDASTGDILWEADGLSGVRGLAVDDDRLGFVLPGSREVQVIDTSTGDLVAETTVGGLPWDAVWLDGEFNIGLYDIGEVVALDRATLTERSRSTVPHGATQLVAGVDQVIVYSALDRTVYLAGNEDPLFYVRNPVPTIATNGTTLAIEGIGFFTTAQPNGMIYRHLMPIRTAETLAVMQNRDVIVGTQDSIVLIRASGSG